MNAKIDQDKLLMRKRIIDLEMENDISNGDKEDSIKKQYAEIIDNLPILASSNKQTEFLKKRIFIEPSGAGLVATDNFYVKFANEPFSQKLFLQAEWLEYASSKGVKCIPKVLAKYQKEKVFFAYVMPKYQINMPDELPDAINTSKKILAELEFIWKVSQPRKKLVDWLGYYKKIQLILSSYNIDAGLEFARIGKFIINLNEKESVSCLVHGDATFENVVYDKEGNIIILDPNPQSSPEVCIPEFDTAKILQSLFGWEAFVYHKNSSLKINTEFLPVIEERFGKNGWVVCCWFLITHLVRTLPYGAKIDNAKLLLPSIETIIGYVGDLLSKSKA